MTNLYNCRHSGDQYRITKFTTDFDVESSYLCTLEECECPAGHRPTCRHRQMLPKFIARQHIGDEWMFDFDRGGWVQSGVNFSEPALEARLERAAPVVSDSDPDSDSGPNIGGFPDWCLADNCITPDDCILYGCAKGHGTPPRKSTPAPLTRRRI